MIGISLKSAAAACGGTLCGIYDSQAQLGEIIIDSRRVKQGDVFAAYSGINTDGHKFVKSALDNGAACCIVQYVPEGVDGPCIVVDDVQRAVEDIARECRKNISVPVIGITGSVGKTTAKEMIWAVLSRKYCTLKTELNYNNQIGVPMTLSRIETDHEMAVIEMGIQDFGEMHLLSSIARPDAAVFTTIGHAHLEFLHDLEGVLRAKTEMLDFMSPEAYVVMNGDDPLQRDYVCSNPKLLYGFGQNCDVRATDIEYVSAFLTRCTINFRDRSIPIEIPAYGRHMVYAALEGAAVGFLYDLTDSEIASGIAAYTVAGRRGVVTDTGFVTLIDDTYNANPDSMMSGIDTLSEVKGRRVCILSDMLELGEDTVNMHRGVGEYALEKGMDLVITYGELAENISLGAGPISQHFSSITRLEEKLPFILHKGDTVLVKGSRGMKLENLSDFIKQLKG